MLNRFSGVVLLHRASLSKSSEKKLKKGLTQGLFQLDRQQDGKGRGSPHEEKQKQKNTFSYCGFQSRGLCRCLLLGNYNEGRLLTSGVRPQCRLGRIHCVGHFPLEIPGKKLRTKQKVKVQACCHFWQTQKYFVSVCSDDPLASRHFDHPLYGKTIIGIHCVTAGGRDDSPRRHVDSVL